MCKPKMQKLEHLELFDSIKSLQKLQAAPMRPSLVALISIWQEHRPGMAGHMVAMRHISYEFLS